MSAAIEKILSEHRQAQAHEPAGDTAEAADKFFSILVGDAMQEHFLELRFRGGLRTCFAYTDLQWFNFDPDASCLDLEFGGFMITVKGRGLGERLFTGLKQKRVAWIKEADSDMQDHDGNDLFIDAIEITPPKGFADE